MLPIGDLPNRTKGNITFISANSVTADAACTAYTIPPGATMLHILLVGGGGPGGSGVVGANSTAAGGGGGGSGSQTSVLIPAHLLPPTIYFSIGVGGLPGAAGILSRCSVYPDALVENTIARANGGGAGGAGSGATGGSAGTAGAASSIGQAPLAGLGVASFLAGQAGIAGGGAVAGAALSLPVTGLIVTGGTGGGGLPAAAAVGTAGGAITVSGRFLSPQNGGLGATVGSAPAGNGSNGFAWQRGLYFAFGGTGGGSTHGSATGAGLVAGIGGVGGPGCGGGGGGGGLTGSTTGTGGKGGDGFAIVTAW